MRTPEDVVFLRASNYICVFKGGRGSNTKKMVSLITTSTRLRRQINITKADHFLGDNASDEI